MPTIDKLSIAEGLLKERYLGTLNNTIVKHSEIIDSMGEWAGESHNGPSGKYWKLANLYAGMEGIGSRLEGQFLPAGGTPQFLNPIVYEKFHYARLDVTYRALVNSVEGPASFGSFAQTYLQPSVMNLTNDLDRQACGLATGVLCRIDGTPSLTMPVDAPFGLASDLKGWLNVRAGMKVVFGPNADGSGLRSAGQAAKVLSVDPTGNSGGGTLILDSFPADALDNDYIFRGDEYAANVPVNGEEPELMGLEGLIDDGSVAGVVTLQGIDRSAVAEWKSTTINAANAPYSGELTSGLLMRAITDAKLIGGGRITHMFTSHDSWRQAIKDLESLGGFGARRDGVTSDVGSKGVTVHTPIGSVELRGVSRLAPGRLYAIDRSTMHRFATSSPEWVDTFGGSIFKQVQVGGAVKDEGYAYYRYPLQLGTSDPRKNVKVYGISESGF